MHCTVFIEDLLLPQSAGPAPYAGLRLSALETLFARGILTSLPAFEPVAWLCRSFSIAKQQDWPTAPLLAHADGIMPGKHFWLHADPVYVQANRGQLVLAQAIADLDEDAAQALVAGLNRHFTEDGLQFYAPQPHRWYLKAEQPPDLTTVPLAQALQRNIDPHLPQGGDALLWHRLLNEAQMILHTQPVNEAREVRGMHPVNSIWLWGGGVMPEIAATPYDVIWAPFNKPESIQYRLAQAVAHACGIKCATPPKAVSLTDSLDKKPLLWLSGHAQAADVDAWRAQMTAIDRNWLTPLLAVLAAGKIERLTLIASNNQRALELNILSAQARRWWQRPRPIVHYIPA